jgi:hypothetical protein
LQRIDVEPRIGLVEDRELGVEDAHLHHLGALLLAARKADIHRALEHLHVEAEQRRLLLGELEELAAESGSSPARALGVEALAQELEVGNAGDLDRILEAEEQAGGGALMRERERGDRSTPASRFSASSNAGIQFRGRAAGHLIARPPAERIGQRRFARAVRPHDRMDLARVDAERQALQDRLLRDGVREVSYLENPQQLLRLHREFHRQLLQHFLAKPLTISATASS